MNAVEFTVDGMDFASSALNPSQLKIVENIAKSLAQGTEDVPRLNDVERIVLTGYSSGTKNLARHANNRALAVRNALESCLRNFGALPVHLAKISIGDPVTKLVATAAQSSAKDRKVVIAIFSNLAPPTPPPGLDLVFVTQGDTRPLLDNRDAAFNPVGTHTSSELWQRRAEDLPRVFDGLVLDDHGAYPRALTPAGGLNVEVRTPFDLTDAQNAIRNLDPDLPLRNVFFLGHGSGTEGFMFSGRPAGPGVLDGMIVDDKAQTLMLSPEDAASDEFMDENKRFFQILATRLATGYAGIWFLSCFVGLSQLHRAAATVLGQKRTNFFVGAYNNFYEVLLSGVLRGTTSVEHHVGAKAFTAVVPRVQRFSHWSDRILDGHTHKVIIGSSGRNKIPRFEVLDGRGQFILDFLRPI